MLTIEEEFKREEVYRQFIQNVRRALIILSILPTSALEDITTTLLFLGAGIVQVQTADNYPEILDTYISVIESNIYSEIQDLEEIIINTITRLRSENIFSELVEVIKENDSQSAEEYFQKFPIVSEIFSPLEQKIRELI